MSCKNPLISIITIAYNADAYLEECIRSIAQQDYSNKEYVIVDGGSTDGTLDIIKKYKHVLDCCLSEPDRGIADAMNKGIAMSSGEYVLFIHADDRLLDDNSLSQAVAELKPECDIHAFSLYFSSAGKRQYRQPRGFTWHLNFKTGLYHQAVFCRRSLFLEIGNFQNKLRIAMDYDFFLRAYRNKICAQMYSLPISVMRDTGISSRRDWASLSARFREEREVHNRHCQNLFQKWLYTVYWVFYWPYRKIRSILLLV